MDYEQLVLDNLSLVDGVVRSIAHRHRLSSDESEELRAGIRLKLVENDYEVLRKFQGRSSIRTYLTTVVTRYFLDERNARWGKWRPSAQARRLGPVAMLLDRLITRDGLQFEQAVQTIAARDDVGASREELQSLLVQLPIRTKRRFVGEEELDAASTAVGGENETIDSLDSPREGDRVENALANALARLGVQDRLILKMRFCDGLTVARISDLLALPQKPLYRRIEDVMRVLRRELEAQGVTQAAIAIIVGRSAAQVGPVLQSAAENRLGGPS